MTEYVRIYKTGYEGDAVDLTNLNPQVQYVINNPLWIMPTGAGNQLIANLNLLSVRITVSFDLVDGIATGSNFDKLLTLASLPIDLFTLTIVFEWGSRSFVVAIESLVVGTKAGQKNLMTGCNMVLVPAREL